MMSFVTNNITEFWWFPTTTWSSRHVGWIRSLWMSHWVELRASGKRNRQETTIVGLFVLFFCFFFKYMKFPLAFFGNCQRDVLTPQLDSPAGLQRVLLVPAWLCVGDLRGCNINQQLQALREAQICCNLTKLRRHSRVPLNITFCNHLWAKHSILSIEAQLEECIGVDGSIFLSVRSSIHGMCETKKTVVIFF